MSDEVFPTLKGLTFPVVKRPAFDTLLQTAPSKHEARIAQTQNPVWRWELIIDYLYSAKLLPGQTIPDYQRLLGFWLSRQGRFESFLFEDVSDNHVGPGLNPDLTPNLTARLQIFSYGGVIYSPIQRRMLDYYEDVTDLQPGSPPIQVYSAGALMTWNVDYVLGGPILELGPLHFDGLFIRWITPPDPPVTADFRFYFRCRFEMDDQDFEEFMSDLWTIGGHGKGGKGSIDLVSVRPPCEIAPLIMSSCPLPDAVDGAAYSFVFQAALGTPPYTWGISEGSSLPDGLSFNNATGELSGTPTETGVFAFTVNVYDAKGNTSSKSCQITVEEHPVPSMSFRVSFEMLASSIFMDDATTDYFCTELPPMGLDTMPGVVAAWWELVVETNPSGSGDSIALADEDGTIYATITGADVGAGKGYTRIRKSFAFPASQKKLHVRVIGSADWLLSDFLTSRVLLDVVGGNAAKVQIPMIVGENSSGGFDGSGNDVDVWCAARSGGCGGGSAEGVYGYDNYLSTDCNPHELVHGLFKKEESRFATIDHWELDVTATLAYFHTAGTGSVGLFNRRTGQMVDGTEQSFTSLTQQERKTISFPNNAANFDDGDEFEVLLKVTGHSGASYAVLTVARADLYVVLTNPSKALLYNRISAGNVSSGSSRQIDVTCRWLHEDAVYAPGFKAYHEATTH